MTRVRSDKVLLALALVTVVAMLGLTVDPWPQDGWFETQYFLVGHFPGQDDYAPIAAPALLYRAAHAIAFALGLHLAGEFYVASVLQNLLVLLGALFLYYTLRTIRLDRLAGPVAVGFTLFVLSTGLAQCFYSENVTIFLVLAALLATVRLLEGEGTPIRFWRLAVACGVAVGLLVATRMVPILLIPGITLLVLPRWPAKRVAQLAGTLTSITALMLASMVLANHVRFGRYELTNSLGRHLWQGVKDLSDRALVRSNEYRALESADPHIHGQNWWEIPPDTTTNVEDWREPVLRRLSIEAIESAPGLYAAEGVKKFVRMIGAAPFRVGFGAPGGPDPLRREQPLPPLATLLRAPAAATVAVAASFRFIYRACRWLYPITLVAIGLYGLALLGERLARALRRRARHAMARRVPLVLLIIVGLPLTAIPVAHGGWRVEALLGAAASVLLLAACAGALHRASQRELEPSSGTHPALFLFLVLLFCGSLWVSWQVEYADSRVTLPYLPLWAVMLALAVDFWMRVAVAAWRPTGKLSATEGTPRPGPRDGARPRARGRRAAVPPAAVRAIASEAIDAPWSNPTGRSAASSGHGNGSWPAPSRGRRRRSR